MAYLPVPNIFANATGSLPLSQLDTDLAYVSAKMLSLADFGAVGDGTTNDYAAIIAAIAAAQARGAGTRLLVPKGTYLHNTAIVVEGTPVQLIGEGMPANANGTLTSTFPGATFKYGGAVIAGASFTWRMMQSSGGMREIGFNADGKSDIALNVDCVTYNVFENVAIYGGKLHGLKVGTDSSGPTNSWNQFRHMHVSSASTGGTTAIWITGNVAGTNTCHNTFINTWIDHHDTAAGMWLGNSDNNTFVDTYIFRSSGAQAGVLTKPLEYASFPQANTFVHLQAGDGGWVQTAAQTTWNSVYDYDRGNGAPVPTIPSGSKLLYTDAWGGQNTYLSIASALNGGGDPRTACDIRNAGGALIIGYQGGALNAIDGADTQIRDASSVSIAQFSSGLVNVSGRVTASGRVDFASTVGNAFAKGVTALGIGADMDITNAGSGVYTIRNLSATGTALLLVDMAGTVTIVSDPAARIAVGADPGAGAGRYWVTVTGTTLRIRNRFVAAQDTAIACVSLYGTPA